jgi:hypothetical protein
VYGGDSTFLILECVVSYPQSLDLRMMSTNELGEVGFSQLYSPWTLFLSQLQTSKRMEIEETMSRLKREVTRGRVEIGQNEKTRSSSANEARETSEVNPKGKRQQRAVEATLPLVLVDRASAAGVWKQISYVRSEKVKKGEKEEIPRLAR